MTQQNESTKKLTAYPPEVYLPEDNNPQIILLGDAGEEKSKYLKVAGRIEMFRKFCAKQNVCGQILTEMLPTQVFRDGNYIMQMKASVILDGVTLATGHGSAAHFVQEYKNKELENAETSAIGRALSAAGFNLPGGDADLGDCDGDRIDINADSPIPLSTDTPTPEEPDVQPDVQQPEEFETEKSEDPQAALKWAYEYIVPDTATSMPGVAGKKIYDLLVENRFAVEFLTGEPTIGKNGKEYIYSSAKYFPELAKACKIALGRPVA